MSRTLTMFREGRTLVPTAEMWAEDLERIPERQEIVVTIKRSRSPQHLRTFFGKLRSAIDLGLWDGDVDSLRNFISIGIGHCTEFVDNTSKLVSKRIVGIARRVLERYADDTEEYRLAKEMLSLAESGRVYFIAKSIAEENMGQDEFTEFDRRSDAFIAERFGIDPAVLFQHMVDKAAAPKRQLSANAESALAEKEERVDLPLDERFRAIGFELGFAKDLDGLEKLWAAAKKRAEVKALFQRAPDVLEEMVAAAREKARGKLDDKAFDRIVRTASGRVKEDA